jgi:hypothetical protein
MTWPGIAKGIKATKLIMFAAVITLERGKAMQKIEINPRENTVQSISIN